jgi:acetolactate synthase I/II/III large subunit
VRRRTGGQVVVDQLLVHGVELAFCVPGESYLPLLDALYDARDRVRLLACRHEGGAAVAAEAYGKLTGRPGVCLVTRGPGASNAAVGLHTAAQDSTPMVLLVGQVRRGHQGREAFQEVDVAAMFGHTTKWAAEVREPARIPELVARAFHVAASGRPGPVALGLPEDVLGDTVEVADAARYRPAWPHPGAADLARLGELLAAARRPLLLAGGPGWTPAAAADLRAFAEANRLPVACSYRAQDVLDNRSASYAGDLGIAPNPALAERVRGADLLLVAGPRLGEVTTSGYTLVEPPRPRQLLVHVHPGAEELGRVYQPDLAVNAAMVPFAAALRALPPVPNPPWATWAEQARADYLAWSEPPPGGDGGFVDLARVVAHLRGRLPAEAIVCNGAGNFTGWLHRYYRYRAFRSQLGPTSGAMGYAVPAAVAAKALHPDRPVVAVTGDGDFLMSGQELATAVQYHLPIVVLLANNGMYGTIRMHQERAYPGRTIATELVNPDFAALARAFGAYGELVDSSAGFPAAFDRARADGRPALLDLRVDPDAISPTTTLTALRRRAG